MSISTPESTVCEADKVRNPPIIRRPDELVLQIDRFENVTQPIYSPSDADPSQPHVDIINYRAGSAFPLRKYDSAQFWYVIGGECEYGDTILRPGDLVYIPDPSFDYQMKTRNGCRILSLQYVSA